MYKVITQIGSVCPNVFCQFPDGERRIEIELLFFYNHRHLFGKSIVFFLRCYREVRCLHDDWLLIEYVL